MKFLEIDTDVDALRLEAEVMVKEYRRAQAPSWWAACPSPAYAAFGRPLPALGDGPHWSPRRGFHFQDQPYTVHMYPLAGGGALVAVADTRVLDTDDMVDVPADATLALLVGERGRGAQICVQASRANSVRTRPTSLRDRGQLVGRFAAKTNDLETQTAALITR